MGEASDMGYPEREPMYALKYIRRLSNSGGAMVVGVEGFALLTVIVMQEDACRYAHAVNFWNHQLMQMVGITSEDRFYAIRARCVKAGWLSYRQGKKGVPPSYFTSNPQVLNDCPDYYCGESADQSTSDTPPIRPQSAPNPPPITPPSIPIPNPIPIPKDSDDLCAPTAGEPDPIPESSRRPYEAQDNLYHQRPDASPDKSGMGMFDAWWDAYGKKVGKQAAIKVWSKLTVEDREAALAATPAYVAWKSDPQYRKDPERFLKGKHWQDEVPVHTPADPQEDPEHDHFYDGAVMDAETVRERLGWGKPA